LSSETKYLADLPSSRLIGWRALTTAPSASYKLPASNSDKELISPVDGLYTFTGNSTSCFLSFLTGNLVSESLCQYSTYPALSNSLARLALSRTKFLSRILWKCLSRSRFSDVAQ